MLIQRKVVHKNRSVICGYISSSRSRKDLAIIHESISCESRVLTLQALDNYLNYTKPSYSMSKTINRAVNVRILHG